jgi:hypothetical protein
LPIQTPPAKRSGAETEWSWDAEVLLDFVNSVRQALSTAIIPRDDLSQLELLITQFLNEGSQAFGSVNIAAITRSRFDKLLEELIGMERPSADYDTLVSKAVDLQRKWKRQFGGSYAMIDKDRFREMATSGVLHDMLCSFDDKKGRAVWIIDRNSSPVETDLKPGQ